MADPAQMEQAIINLAINARDAMPDGGQLRIRTEDVTVEEGSGPESTGVKPGDYVLLTFTDTGAGMSDETMGRIFEPFFTTKETGKGTGLGLSMVYGMVKQSGGYIFARSRPGTGSTFLIYLPCTDGTPESLPPGGETEHRGGSETILLAEDQKEVRTFVARTLARLGYGVLETRNGKEAWEIIKNGRTKIDLLLTDEIMPLMGGRELAALTREESPETRLIFMTGYSGRTGTENDGTGDADSLQKPISMKRLAHAVRVSLDRNGSGQGHSSSTGVSSEGQKEENNAKGGSRS
jgi:CheY-like chemotaxis protein